MVITLLRRCRRFLSCERAVSTLEYAILAGVIVAGVGAAIVTFTGDITTAIGNIGDKIDDVSGPAAPTLTPSSD